eukprot:GFUD01039515.1.p2 GENE.GFUD01039515.1~~GFUD01039515.1.p2  ORF type:complete len:188 (+),score=55.29 GFUD01039515.1:41-604(+)
MGSLASKSKLSPEDVSFLTENTQYSSQEVFNWFSTFKRDCPSGKLGPDKFIKMYSKFFPSGNSKPFCEHVFRIFDTDKNGVIDFKEFLLAIDVSSGSTPQKKLEWAFKMYDVNGNGVITMDEMKEVVGAMFKMQFSQGAEELQAKIAEKSAQIFSAMDSNKDGIITQEEFLMACTQDRQIMELMSGK